MLHFLWMFIVGIVVGALARLIMPGKRPDNDADDEHPKKVQHGMEPLQYLD